MYRFRTYWTDKMKIDFLQRVILIHSYLYYQKDASVWTDKHYDEIAKQLVSLQESKTKRWVKQNTQYGHVFYDYDGTTGFDLWDRLKQEDRDMIAGIAENK